ncbi:hypothetical protein SDC9_102262 [bioreactor metagenome]|uniref:Uncharacterized protein n=1 Tax=bioreactor metagenome TaxID=1076179 RepID=A0A645AQB9_9ZZZZ
MVGVLIFVHQHVAEFPLVILPHLFVLLKEGHGVEDNVVKVQRIGGTELFHIAGVNLGNAGHFPVAGVLILLCKVLRRLETVPGFADDSQQISGGKGLFVIAQLFENVLEDPLGIVSVVDGEVLLKADALNIPPQNAHAGGVEGGGPDVVCLQPQTVRQTGFQLARRLVGKGDGDDLPRTGRVHGAKPHRPPLLLLLRVVGEALQKQKVLLRRVLGNLVAVAAPAIGQQVVYPLNENGGFAGPGPRQQKQRSLGGHGGLPLHGVQPPKVPGDKGFPGGNKTLVEISHMFTSFL